MSTSVLPRPEVAPPRPWSFPTADRFTLANGLSVVAYHLPGKHVVSMRLLLDLQLRAEPSGLEGIAQLAVQALDEGTERYTAQAFAAARDRIGATYQVACDASGATVVLDAPSTRLPAALELLAEVALRPTFPTSEIDRLVKARLDEVTNERANPDARARLELAAAWHKVGSRRALPEAGTATSVAGITRDAVASFYNEQVDPATTTLVVAGDLSGIDLTALVTSYFADWTTRGRVRSTPTGDDVVAGPRVVLVDRPGSVQTSMILGLPFVPRDHPDFAPLQVAAHVLGGDMDSRLMTVLREEKGYTYGVYSRPVPGRRDGRLHIGGAFQTESTTDAVTDLMAILHAFVDGGIKESERVSSIESLAGRAPLSYELPQSVAAMASVLIAQELPSTFVDDNLAALRAATGASIDAAFRSSVPLDRAVLIAVGDASVIHEGLVAAGLGEVTVVPA